MDNSHYTLIGAAVQLGGLCNGEVLSLREVRGGAPSGGLPRERGGPEGLPHHHYLEYVQEHRAENYKRSLSTVHISPKNTKKPGKTVVWLGGSLIKASVSREYLRDAERKESKRGQISGFSWKSRRRLLRFMGMMNRAAHWDFVTLTYPAEFSKQPAEYKRHLDMFRKRLKYHFPGVAAVWKLEPQKRGAPHFHLLVYGANLDELRAFVPQNWYEIVGSGNENHLKWHAGKLGNEHCVQPMKSVEGVMAYTGKYFGKVVDTLPEEYAELWANIGRYWGVMGRENLPLAPEVEIELTDKQTFRLIRYMRRFAKLKSRSYKSLTVLCNAEHWFDHLNQLIE